MISQNRLLTNFFTFLFLMSLSAFAQEDEQYKVSDERVNTISSIIAKAVEDKADLSNPAVVQAIYNKVGKEMPLTPTEPLMQVDLKKLNKEARAKALEKFKASPVKLKNKLTAEAEEKFPLAKIRDKVTVIYKRGTITGTLYKIGSNNILVNTTTISFIDMDKLTRGRFDPQYNADLRAQYVQEHLGDYNQEFNNYQQKVFESLLAEANGENEKNGYIFLKRREAWKTAQEVTASELTPEIERYKKMKAKQERIRRKREAKEQAAREAKEKAEAEAKAAAEQAQNTENNPAVAATGGGEGGKGNEIPPDQIKDNPYALPAAPEEEQQTASVDPQDILNTENSETNILQPDEGGTFIALTPEQLAALSRPKVSETAYRALMAKIEAKQKEISNKYFGIDADQGFKKALWGFRETDVYYALSKETDAAFIKKLRINRNDILYPEGSRPKKIYLHYHLGELYAVDIFMGNLKPKEFNIYKNSLQQKYGKSDTQQKMGDDVFLRIAEGTLPPSGMPKFVEAKPDETGMDFDVNEEEKSERTDEGTAGGEQSQPQNGEEAPANPEAQPAADGENNGEQPAAQENLAADYNGYYFFVWEGVLSRGVLSFRYNIEKQIYENVLFEKMYLPLRLKKYEERRAAGSKPKASAEDAPAAGK